jgi:phosphoglycerate dehydrogenase-like enzyme
MKNKIAISGKELTVEQKKHLKKLGDVKYFPSASSSKELLEQVKEANILYSDGSFLLESLPKFRNLFVTYPYVELGVFNSVELKKHGVIIANAQGGNRPSIIEWVMFMVLSLFRKFNPMIRAKGSIKVDLQESLNGKKVLIVGKGSIGTKIAIPCEAFGMKVDFFKRGDNLKTKSANVDLIINALNCNSSSKNLLDEKFFLSLKKGTYFISFVRQYTYSLDGLLKSINKGIIAGAAIDCDPEDFGDTRNSFYQEALSNPKVLVTPHVAWSTKQAIVNGGEIAVQNIEAYVTGKPQNVLVKK